MSCTLIKHWLPSSFVTISSSPGFSRLIGVTMLSQIETLVDKGFKSKILIVPPEARFATKRDGNTRVSFTTKRSPFFKISGSS
ncbi:MAG: hypothetical protein BWY75_01943 [bacterium ADurb.Bin425]|nr:MAG: hypothetical protein BWY75_01943 [bacterium ADurb.Bin425]